VFDRFCEEPTIMCATHFPAPSTGQVRRWGDGFKFVGSPADPPRDQWHRQ
jgi:hypothetical protein